MGTTVSLWRSYGIWCVWSGEENHPDYREDAYRAPESAYVAPDSDHHLPEDQIPDWLIACLRRAGWEEPYQRVPLHGE